MIQANHLEVLRKRKRRVTWVLVKLGVSLALHQATATTKPGIEFGRAGRRGVRHHLLAQEQRPSSVRSAERVQMRCAYSHAAKPSIGTRTQPSMSTRALRLMIARVTVHLPST